MEEKLQHFEQWRPKLLAIAYRMLGSYGDAEDILQETSLKWLSLEISEIKSVEAYLTTITTRLCIDFLRSSRRKREQYDGEWLPEPIDTSNSSEQNLELADSISTAFLLVLQSLTPTERAVFLLRDIFDYDYQQIGNIVEMGNDNCRQLLSRARNKLEEKKPRFEVDPQKHSELLALFMTAIERENSAELESVLAQDAILFSDHGGKAIAARRRIYGKQKITRLLVSLRRKNPSFANGVEIMNINGKPGLVLYEESNPQSVLTFMLEDNLIKHIYFMRNPDKLKQFVKH